MRSSPIAALDNVAYALKMRGAGQADRHAQARELLPRCSSRSSPTGCRPNFRWPAAARRAGPRADHPPAGAAARRAALGARRIPARAHAGRTEPGAAGAGHHLHPCDAQPARGDGAGRHGRGDGAGPHRAGRHRPRHIREAAQRLCRALHRRPERAVRRRREHHERRGSRRRQQRRPIRHSGGRPAADARFDLCGGRSGATASPSRRSRRAPGRCRD